MHLFTVGHSNRSLEEFVEILLAHGVKRLIDVRTLPGSTRYPHFNGESLKVQLARFGIRYQHMKALGGVRHSLKNSQNGAWRNLSFRGYADYMQTKEFAKAMNRLCITARKEPTCLMCAEAVPWRCHRSLIADALFARRIEVIEIFSLTQSRVHKLTGWAKIEGRDVTYPLTGKPTDRPENCLIKTRKEIPMIQLKRAYDSASRTDGYRVLIDRLWPRGIKKADLVIDEWAKVLAPTTELRRYFGHDPKRWSLFQSRYKAELHSNDAKKKLNELAERARKGKLTLVYSAKDTEHNDAVVLRAIIEREVQPEKKKGSGARSTK